MKQSRKVCPYIGLNSDPETHMQLPSFRHYCFRVEKSRPVETDYQEQTCLCGSYARCLIYQQGEVKPIPAGIFRPQGVLRKYLILRKKISHAVSGIFSL